ncbi:MAG: organomercurial lyase [Armatimonadia bacterium]
MLRKHIGLFVIIAVAASVAVSAGAQEAAKLPKLLDLGSTTCIPCKQMAPILEELKKELVGKIDVEFVNVNDRLDLANKYKIEFIPTQVFLDANSKELFRHVGFYGKDEILAKLTELGLSAGTTFVESFSRWEPVQPDTRAKDAICYMCDGDVNPRTTVAVRTAKGDVHLCSPHCLSIMLSSLTADRAEVEKLAYVTDFATGQSVPLQNASYLYTLDEQTGRPSVIAFASRDAALAARRDNGGSVLTYPLLQAKETATRCGFCDRAVYPDDAALVKAGGVYTYGCCSHCALGVAARTGASIEVHERDRLTGEPIIIKTLEGKIASLEPATAVAWFGQRTKPDGKRASAGCFHQGFFVSSENLQKWVAAHPLETGEMIPIAKALADKMALSAEQISKACKIGECAPK